MENSEAGSREQEARAHADGQRVVRTTQYKIRDADGTLVVNHVRYDHADGDKHFSWAQPDGTFGLNGRRVTLLPLYGAERLRDLPSGSRVVVVEGETACEVLWRGNVAAVATVTGSSTIPDDPVFADLAGFRVTLWPDNDDGGRRHMNQIAERLVGASIPTTIVSWPDAPPKGDAADFEGDDEALATLIDRATPWTPDAGSTDGADDGFVSAATFMAGGDTPPKWQAEGLLLAGGSSLWVAKPKVGKSTGARDLTLATARGTPFLGRPVRQGPVLYLTLEENEDSVRADFRKLGLRPDDPVYLHIGPLKLRPGENKWTWLRRKIKATGAVLVVIDTWGRFIKMKDGNSYTETTDATEPLLTLIADTDVHVLLTHHAKKGSLDELEDILDAALGSTAITATVGTILVLKRRKDGTRTLLTRQRRGADLAESLLTLDPASGRLVLGLDIETKGVETAKAGIRHALTGAVPDGLTQEEIRKRVTGDVKTVVEALTAMKGSGEVVTVSGRGKKGSPYRYLLAVSTNRGDTSLPPYKHPPNPSKANDFQGIPSDTRIPLAPDRCWYGGKLAENPPTPDDDLDEDEEAV